VAQRTLKALAQLGLTFECVRAKTTTSPHNRADYVYFLIHFKRFHTPVEKPVENVVIARCGG